MARQITFKSILASSYPLTLITLVFLSAATHANAAPPQPTKGAEANPDRVKRDRQELLRQAWHLYDILELKASMETFNNVIQSLPVDRSNCQDDAIAFLGRAQCEEHFGQYAKAAADIREYVQVYRSARWGAAVVCRILAEGEDYKESIVCLNEYSFAFPTHCRPYGLIAVCAAFLHDYRAAESNLVQALMLNFSKRDLDISDGTFSPEKTMSIFRKRCLAWIRQHPKDIHFPFTLAVIDTLSQNYKTAIDELSAILRADPKMSEALNVRANCYIGAKNFTNAMADIDRAIEIAPEDLDNYKTLERYYNISGNFDKLFQDLDHRIAKNPHNPAVFVAKGNAYERLGEAEKAIEAYGRAIAINPRCADAFNGRGRLKEQLFKHTEAITDFSSSIKLEPTNPNSYRDRATSYSAVHKDKEALADISRVIDLTQDPRAYAVRAAYYRKAGKLDLAAKDKRAADQNIFPVNQRGFGPP